MQLKIYSFLIIIILSQINGWSQKHSNDIEKYNLKGNIQFLFYESYFPIEFEGLKEIKNKSDNSNYYVSFDKNGHIDFYGLYETKLSNGKNIIKSKIKVYNDSNKNIVVKDKENNLLESTVLIEKGYFKNLPLSKTICEYYSLSKNSNKPVRITRYKADIDTSDIGYEEFIKNPIGFSEEEYVKYLFNKECVEIYNQDGKLVKKYEYYNYDISSSDDYSDKQENIFEYEYDSIGNLKIEKKYNQKWFRHKDNYRYEYTFDHNKNWTVLWIFDETLINDKVKKIVKRKIVYRNN